MRNFKRMKLIFAIVFTIPLIVWAFFLASYIQKKTIIATGKEAVAVVTGYQSNIKVNDEPFYKLFYVFEDDQGNTHEGETESVYTYYTASHTEHITVKYNSNFESVPINYVPANKILLIVLPIFGIVGIGFWIALFLEIRGDILAKEIIKKGTPNKANFLYANSKMSVNNVPYFYIQFEYTDAKGQLKETRTPNKYTYEEQAFFQQLGKFDIMEYHGHVVVNQKIDISELNKKMKKEEAGLVYKTCKYCGSTISAVDKKCPNCGSSEFET